MDHWSRRQFVQGVGAAGLALVAGCGRLPGQAPPPPSLKLHRLGYLSSGNPAGSALVLELLWQALGQLGYVQDENLTIEGRWSERNYSRLAEAAAELVRLPVEI